MLAIGIQLRHMPMHLGLYGHILRDTTNESATTTTTATTVLSQSTTSLLNNKLHELCTTVDNIRLGIALPIRIIVVRDDNDAGIIADLFALSHVYTIYVFGQSSSFFSGFVVIVRVFIAFVHVVSGRDDQSVPEWRQLYVLEVESDVLLRLQVRIWRHLL